MHRDALERLSKAELIELVLRLQRPDKTSRTSSKPPSTDRKERRERAKPGVVKPGHAGHSRPLSDDVSERMANTATHLAASTLAAKRRALERRLDAILATPSGCELTQALQAKLRRARDQLLTFVDWPGQVEATNNACERDLRPAVIQRKVTNGYRAMWAAQGEADVRTVVDTARLAPNTSVFGTILTTVTA